MTSCVLTLADLKSQDPLASACNLLGSQKHAITLGSYQVLLVDVLCEKARVPQSSG